MTRLQPCPATNNCVSSEATEAKHRAAPIPFKGEGSAAADTLFKILSSIERSDVRRLGEGAIAATFRTRIFHFADDAEFLIDEPNHLIHFRSTARKGVYDFGVNRARIERIRTEFAKAASR